MKNSIFILAILILGCKENNDPFKTLKFGEVSKNVTIQNLLKEQIISEPRKDINGNDSVAYTYYFEDKLGKIPVKFEANPELFDFGNLKEIRLTIHEDDGFFLDLVEDSTETSNLKRIKKLYEKWYNKPDSMKFALNVPGGRGALIWEAPLFNIYINNISSEPNVKTYVVYRMLDYEKEIARLKDSIVKNQTVKQLVKDGRISFNWKKLSNLKYRFSFEVYGITRKDRYDSRGIKSIRFDLLLEDEFGKELYKEFDFTLELKHELYPRDKPYSFLENAQSYHVDYNVNNRALKDLEKARIYAKNYNLKGRALIKSVVMEDGGIIK